MWWWPRRARPISGELGRLYHCRMFYGNGTARDVRNSPWRDQGAGVLADLGSHLLDTVLFWFGGDDRRFRVVSRHRFENAAFDHVVVAAEGAPDLRRARPALSLPDVLRQRDGARRAQLALARSGRGRPRRPGVAPPGHGPVLVRGRRSSLSRREPPPLRERGVRSCGGGRGGRARSPASSAGSITAGCSTATGRRATCATRPGAIRARASSPTWGRTSWTRSCSGSGETIVAFAS